MARALELGESGASAFALGRVAQHAASWLSGLEPLEAEGLSWGHRAGEGAQCKETKAQRGHGAYRKTNSQGGRAGSGGLVFPWGGCLPLCWTLGAGAGAAAGVSPQGDLHSAPHPCESPQSWEVKFSAPECVNPREEACVSHSPLTLNILLRAEV